jgi:hypothetical protein
MQKGVKIEILIQKLFVGETTNSRVRNKVAKGGGGKFSGKRKEVSSSHVGEARDKSRAQAGRED